MNRSVGAVAPHFPRTHAYSSTANAMSNSAVSSPAPTSKHSASYADSRESCFYDRHAAERGERAQRRRLYELFEAGVLSDVVLVVQGERIAAHRVILATASPFFHALFTSGMKESREHEIVLHDLHGDALRELLVYMYLGELCITGDTILATLHTANQLEMLEVVEICCKQLMVELNVANCVDIYVCCEALKTRAPCHTLAHAALAMVEAFLPAVMETEAFLNLPLPLVAKILLRQQHTHGCEAALQAWVAYDPETRHSEVQAILQSCAPQRLEFESNGIECEDAAVDEDHDEVALWGRSTDSSPLKTPVVFAIGGFNGPSAMSSVEHLDYHSSEWFSVASMHERRSYGGVVVTDDDKIIVLGGSSNSRHHKSVEQFDPATNTWELLPPMRKSRSYLGAAYLDGYIYVVGGFNGMSHLATVERFDLERQKWEELAPLNVGRSGLAAVVANGYIYAIGGYDGRRHLKSIEEYDPRRNQWTLLPNKMRHARNGPAAVAVLKENAILVFGGESLHGIRMNTSERFLLGSGEWEDVDPFVDSRSGHVAVSMLRDSFVFCFGGSNKKDEYLDDVHRFDPLTKQWLPHSRMDHQRCGLGVAVVRVSPHAACFQSMNKRLATLTTPPSPDYHEHRSRGQSPSGVDGPVLHAFPAAAFS